MRNRQQRYEGGVVLYMKPRKAPDCDEQFAQAQREIVEANDNIADGHEWARRCRDTIRESLKAENQ